MDALSAAYCSHPHSPSSAVAAAAAAAVASAVVQALGVNMAVPVFVLQVGVFSATLPPEALEITRKFMNKPVSRSNCSGCCTE